MSSIILLTHTAIRRYGQRKQEVQLPARSHHLPRSHLFGRSRRSRLGRQHVKGSGIGDESKMRKQLEIDRLDDEGSSMHNF